MCIQCKMDYCCNESHVLRSFMGCESRAHGECLEEVAKVTAEGV